MMEKLSPDEFLQNFTEVKEKMAKAFEISGRTPDEVTLLAAIKTVDAESVNFAIENGISYIGENRVQEFNSKNSLILPTAHRHFIGHLQTNKVKDVVGKVELIHSVDSVKLAKEISRQSVLKGVRTDILLEVNIGLEESKWGFNPDNLEEAITEIAKLDNISIKGLMAIPPVCNEAEENRKYFRSMHKLFVDIGAKKIDNSSMEILSMGMSNDFDIAIEEGSTLIRLGTALFGSRY